MRSSSSSSAAAAAPKPQATMPSLRQHLQALAQLQPKPMPPPPMPKPGSRKRMREEQEAFIRRGTQTHHLTVPKDEDDDGRLTLGIDPGTINCAWAWLNAKAGKARVQLHDFSVWDGYKHKVNDYGERMFRLVRKYEEAFKNCKLVAIERQSHPKKNLKVFVAIMQLYQTIRCLHPRIPVRWVEPRSVRKMWNTSGGPYDTRKEASCYTDLLANPMHTFEFDRTFKKNSKKGIYEDPYEACQLAIYAHLNHAKIAMPPTDSEQGAQSNDEVHELVVDVKVGKLGVPRKTLAQAASAAGCPNNARWHIPPSSEDKAKAKPKRKSKDALPKSSKPRKPRAYKPKTTK